MKGGHPNRRLRKYTTRAADKTTHGRLQRRLAHRADGLTR